MQRKERILRKYFKRLLAPLVRAVLDKLIRNERKYRWGRSGMTKDWEYSLRKEIREHVDKGDPLDVIIYAAYAWLRGWSLAWPVTVQEPPVYANAQPVEFDGQNYIFRCGPIPNCQPLPCFVTWGAEVPSVTSCWKLSPAALAEVARTGQVYIQTQGQVPPPVYADGLPPFNADDQRRAAVFGPPSLTMDQALAQDARDREAAARPLPTVDQAFDEGGQKIQAAIQKLGRQMLDATDAALAHPGGVPQYPERHVQAVGLAALAFFTAWSELYSADIIDDIVGEGPWPYADREGWDALRAALDAYAAESETAIYDQGGQPRVGVDYAQVALDAASQGQDVADLVERGDLGAKPEDVVVDYTVDITQQPDKVTAEVHEKTYGLGVELVTDPPAPAGSFQDSLGTTWNVTSSVEGDVATVRFSADVEFAQQPDPLPLGPELRQAQHAKDGDAQRQARLDDLLAQTLAGNFEPLKEFGTLVQAANLYPDSYYVRATYHGEPLFLGDPAKVEAHVRAAFDYYVPAGGDGVVYLARRDEAAQHARTRELGKLVRTTVLDILQPGQTPISGAWSDAWADTLGKPAADVVGHYRPNSDRWLVLFVRGLLAYGTNYGTNQGPAYALALHLLDRIYYWCRAYGISPRRWEAQVAQEVLALGKRSGNSVTYVTKEAKQPPRSWVGQEPNLVAYDWANLTGCVADGGTLTAASGYANAWALGSEVFTPADLGAGVLLTCTHNGARSYDSIGFTSARQRPNPLDVSFYLEQGNFVVAMRGQKRLASSEYNGEELAIIASKSGAFWFLGNRLLYNDAVAWLEGEYRAGATFYNLGASFVGTKVGRIPSPPAPQKPAPTDRQRDLGGRVIAQVWRQALGQDPRAEDFAPDWLRYIGEAAEALVADDWELTDAVQAIVRGDKPVRPSKTYDSLDAAVAWYLVQYGKEASQRPPLPPSGRNWAQESKDYEDGQ